MPGKTTAPRKAPGKKAAPAGSARTARARRQAERRRRRLSALQRAALFVLAALLVAATVFFLVLRRGNSTSISENAIGSLLSPVQSGITTGVQAVRRFFTRWGDYDRMQAAYDQMTYENQSLKLQLQNAEEALKENEALREALDAVSRYETLNPVYARVIARDPGRWFSTFSVNRGSINGVSAGMAVCTGDGLVGRVYEVGLNYAKILTVTDPRSATACLIARTRDNGVMRGQIVETSESQDCYVYYLPNVNNVAPGDQVITSGTDSLYPKGLAIGEVTAISREGGADGNYVVVRPYADFQHLEHVLILREVIETDKDILSAVPTPTPKPEVTPTPTPALTGAEVGQGAEGTAQPGEWQYPTATPAGSAQPGTPGSPIRYENLPEDSWAEASS